MQIQMLLPLETFHAYAADVRPFRIVTQFVPFQVLLPLQTRAADVANEPPLDFVHRKVLFKALFLRIGHVALGAAEQDRPVERRGNMHLSRLLPFRLRRFRFVLSFLSSFSRTDRHAILARRTGRRSGGRSRCRRCRGGFVVVATGGVAGYTAGILETTVSLAAIRAKLSIVVGVLVDDFALNKSGPRGVGYGTADQVVSMG